MSAISKSILPLPVVLSIAAMAGAVAAHSESVVEQGHFMQLPIDSSAKEISVEARVALPSNKPVSGLGKAMWQLVWCDSVSGRPGSRITLQWGNEHFGDPFDRRYMRVAVYTAETDSCYEKLLYDGVNLYRGFNTLSVQADDAATRLWIGDNNEMFIGTFPPLSRSNAIRIEGNRKLKVDWFAVDCTPDLSLDLLTGWADTDALEARLKQSSDPLEGVWTFLDRDTDDKLAVPGGDYSLAIVRNNDVEASAAGTAVYDIIYLGGAKVNPSEWQPGMLKGRLIPTAFENHFNLEWYDAMLGRMDEEISVDFTPPLVLTLNFPLYSSRMRFSRCTR